MVSIIVNEFELAKERLGSGRHGVRLNFQPQEKPGRACFPQPHLILFTSLPVMVNAPLK